MEKSNWIDLNLKLSDLNWINKAEANVEETHGGHHHQGTLLHIPLDKHDDNEFEEYEYVRWR